MLPPGYFIRLMQPADYGRIGEICRAVYPHETPYTPEELAAHRAVFPQGQFVAEPPGGAHRDPRQMATKLKTFLLRTLRELVTQPGEALVATRYEKFRRMGVFLEAEPA